MKFNTNHLTGLGLVFVLIVSGGSGARTAGQLANTPSTNSTMPKSLGVADGSSQPLVAQTKSSRDQAHLAQSFGQMPLVFIQNQGQMDSRVAYYLQGQDTSIYFTSAGLTFSMGAPTMENSSTTRLPSASIPKGLPEREPGINQTKETSRWVLKLDFLGANPGVVPQGEDKAETVVSYFKGKPDQWRTGLPTFRRVIYHDLWPGIDLVYFGTTNRLKYEFIVKPDADPRQIRLAYRGANDLKLDGTEQLEVSTPFGSLQDEAPFAYQVSGGRQVEVAVSYKLLESGRQPVGATAARNAPNYSFDVSAYDPALPLVIDPAILVYCGYLGGSSIDDPHGIAVDGSGAAYITGETWSDQSTFPVTVGPDLTFNNYWDVFVAKVSPDGKGLVYAGYIGGNGEEYGNGIAVDGSGAAYVTGITDSDQTTFPVLVGPDLTSNGFADAFVAKVRPDGKGLVYAGYIGGSVIEEGSDIVVDGSGVAYIVGDTTSNETTFPVLVGPDLTFNGVRDAFVAKVRPDGTGLVYAGYIGGSGEEYGFDISIDTSGAAYITGKTKSDQSTFPVTVGPDLTLNGSNDAFVVKVVPDGTGLVYAGYVGGSKSDVGYGIAVDGSGAAFIIGETLSDQTTFPVTVGPDLTFNGTNDAFVAKVRPDGTGLVYAGYYGGDNVDSGYDIAVDTSGAAYLTGSTYSDESTFPVTVGPDLTFNGYYDAFVAKVRPDGTGLVYSGYIGGDNMDAGQAIALDQSGAAYITGETYSNQTTFPVTGGPDLTFNGLADAFVAKISLLNKQVYIPFIQISN